MRLRRLPILLLVSACLLGAAMPAPASAAVVQVPYGELIVATAQRYDLSVALLTGLVWQESRFDARARSKAGARGLTQLMPATARSLGVRDAYDPVQNLDGGARYLKLQLLRFRNTALALAAYNAGPGAVVRYRGIPPFKQTRAYVRNIVAVTAQLHRLGIR